MLGFNLNFSNWITRVDLTVGLVLILNRVFDYGYWVTYWWFRVSNACNSYSHHSCSHRNTYYRDLIDGHEF